MPNYMIAYYGEEQRGRYLFIFSGFPIKLGMTGKENYKAIFSNSLASSFGWESITS